MIVYTYSEARQKLARVLNQVLEQGEVRIKRKDGQIFVIKAEAQQGSPLDVRWPWNLVPYQEAIPRSL